MHSKTLSALNSDGVEMRSVRSPLSCLSQCTCDCLRPRSLSVLYMRAARAERRIMSDLAGSIVSFQATAQHCEVSSAELSHGSAHLRSKHCVAHCPNFRVPLDSHVEKQILRSLVRVGSAKNFTKRAQMYKGLFCCCNHACMRSENHNIPSLIAQGEVDVP
jgi:hypothetical protein